MTISTSTPHGDIKQTTKPSLAKAPTRSGTGASWHEEFVNLTNNLKLRHYSPKTLKAYTHWVRKLQAFTQSKPPQNLVVEDVKRFLTDLAVVNEVSASTQNQAFNALLYFFRHVLKKEFGKVDGVVRARRKRTIPIILTREEVDTVISRLEAPFDLVTKLLYGCGLRISECLQLRVGCLNFELRILTVYDGKGQKDRTVPLPESIVEEIRRHLQVVSDIHQTDIANGYAGVFLPKQLEKKYRKAPREYVWQWLFPAKRLTRVQDTGEFRRFHMYPAQVSTALKAAVQLSAIPKRVNAYTFRHSFASHLLLANYDIRTIQELLGHDDVRTTRIYTHTVPGRTHKERRSPLDF